MSEFHGEIWYGLKPMSLEDEIRAPETIRNTRQSKVDIIDKCAYMQNLLDVIRTRAKWALELDDVKHAALVKEFRDKVSTAMEALVDATMIGRM